MFSRSPLSSVRFPNSSPLVPFNVCRTLKGRSLPLIVRAPRFLECVCDSLSPRARREREAPKNFTPRAFGDRLRKPDSPPLSSAIIVPERFSRDAGRNRALAHNPPSARVDFHIDPKRRKLDDATQDIFIFGRRFRVRVHPQNSKLPPLTSFLCLYLSLKTT